MMTNQPIDKGSIAQRSYMRFFRLSIAGKLLLGYLSLASLLILISLFTLSTLEKLNTINKSIIKTDLPLMEAGDKMIDSLLAQESYGRRYVILQSQEMLDLFKERGAEFDQLFSQIHLISDGPVPGEIERLKKLHDEYNELFLKGTLHLYEPASSSGNDYDRLLKEKVDEIINGIKKISTEAKLRQNRKAVMTSTVGDDAFRVTWLLSLFGIIFSVIAAILITRNISGAIHQLKLATKKISEGKFDYVPNIRNQDELGELSGAFIEMAKRLKRLEEMYLDASPLTRLPGGIAIENILNKRLGGGVPSAFCLFDLDNFKAFSDRYGYARGSEVIKATAKLIEGTVKKYGGGEEDFVGHIGGDDFVLITSPERYADICNGVIEEFDRMIPAHYDSEDRARGYIAGKTRQGEELDFPLMTVSIAVVTNKDHKFSNSVEIGEVAAELKEYAKSQPGSLFVVDKRRKPFHQVEHSEKDTVPHEKKKFRRRMRDV